MADEMYGQIPFNMLKRICGFAPCVYQVKGGAVQVLAKKFVFTSTVPPERWYPDERGEWKRRINEFGIKIDYPRVASG